MVFSWDVKIPPRDYQGLGSGSGRESELDALKRKPREMFQTQKSPRRSRGHAPTRISTASPACTATYPCINFPLDLNHNQL